MNLPTADKIRRQTGATCLEYNFCLTFAIIHRVEIVFLFIYIFQTFEARTRANQANITGLGKIDLSDTNFTLEKLFLKRAEREAAEGEAALLAKKSR